jgi:iron complex transport system substrate-binding protein
LDRLRRLGLRVVALEPRSLEDIGAQIRQIGELAGTAVVAAAAADRFDSELARLRQRYGAARPIRVFYQISAQPLITIGAGHFISQALAVCAGENIFAELRTPAAVVSREAVIAGAPEVIIASEPNLPAADRQRGEAELNGWRTWPAIPAVAAGHLFLIDPGLVSVPGPRLTIGIGQVCDYLAMAREERPRRSGPRAGLPEHFRPPGGTTGQSGNDEQQVGQAVQVAEGVAVERFAVLERPGPPLGPPAHSPGQVAVGSGQVPAG